MLKNIYKYIENYDLTQENFLDFVTTLSDYFSQKFKVRKCLIEIDKLDLSSPIKNTIAPAQYSNLTKIIRDENTGIISYQREKESIKFSYECLNEKNKAYIIKLLAHEWMHFYNALFKWKELDINNANQEYKDLIIKSIQYGKYKNKLKEKYSAQTFAHINKLCAEERVADKHAQDFLNELYVNVLDARLKQQIEKQVQKYNNTIKEFIKYLENEKVTEECIIK